MNTKKSTQAAGDLDPAFGEGGIVFSSFGPETIDAAILGIDVAPDGKLLISGNRGPNDYALARLNSDGSVDPSFGNAGAVVGQFRPGVKSAAGTVMVTPDEKLIVIGKVYITEFVDYRALMRLNPDGSLDTSFGEQGIVILDLPLDKSGTESNPSTNDPEALQTASQATNALLQGDGKIVVSDTFDHIAVIFRLNPNGSLDTSFNGTGYVSLRLTDAWTSLGALYLENDKIIASGSYRHLPTTDSRPLAVRYNADGSLDSSFGENGIFIVPADITNNEQAQFLDALRESNGNILGIGSTVVSPLKALVLGMDKDGSADPAFNGGEALFTEIGTQGNQWNNTDLDNRSGMNVLCGVTLGSDSSVIVGRIDNQGVWDTRFGGTQGWVRISLTAGHTVHYDVAVQSDGNILVAGMIFPESGLMKGFVFRVQG